MNLSRPIDATERALIDAAVEAGRVTVCPPRTHALWPSTVPLSAEEAVANAKAIFWGRRPNPRVAERRAKVADLHNKGMTQAQIAEALGISERTVSQDRSYLRNEGRIEEAAVVRRRLGLPYRGESQSAGR